MGNSEMNQVIPKADWDGALWARRFDFPSKKEYNMPERKDIEEDDET